MCVRYRRGSTKHYYYFCKVNSMSNIPDAAGGSAKVSDKVVRHANPNDIGEDEAEPDVLRAVCRALADRAENGSGVSEAEEEKEKATEPEVTEAQGFEMCELCNTVIDPNDEVEDHYQRCHAVTAPMRQIMKEPAAATATPPVSIEMDRELGRFALRLVSTADLGEKMFGVIQDASRQLNSLLHDALDEKVSVFLFGSCVSMGIWDGMGDADYCVATTSLLREDATAGVPSRREEPRLLNSIARMLRFGGFRFEELEVLARTRTPIVKRKRDIKRPYELRRVGENYIIDYTFEQQYQLRRFTERDIATIETNYKGTCNVPRNASANERNRAGLRRSFSFNDGALALRLFRRREGPGVEKVWRTGGRLPEIFFVDFDLSCRTFGVRNSWFLRSYLAQDPVFRAGNHFIKQWSKKSGVNNSRVGYLTSYAMTVLWIYYLLRTGEASFVDPTTVSAVPTPEQLTVPYMPLRPPSEDGGESESDRIQRLGRLLRGFFYFYGYAFDWSSEVVSLRTNCQEPDGILTRDAAGWTMEKEVNSIILRNRVFYNLCIDDVYEDNLNLGRHLSQLKGGWVRQQFRQAWQCTESEVKMPHLLKDRLSEAKATLRMVVYQYLLEEDGHATVGDLRKHLEKNCIDELCLYEMQYRLSDLWRDEDRLKKDDENNVINSRRVDSVYDPKTSAVASGRWEAVADERRFGPLIKESPDDAFVYLTHRSVNYDVEHQEPITEAQKNALEKQLKQIYPQYLRVMEKLEAHPDEGCEVDRGSLLCDLFFCLDERRVFATYDAMEAFRAHLKTVAIAVEELAAKKERVPVARLSSVLCEMPAVKALQPKLVAVIVSSPTYVQRDNGMPTPTLKAYAGDVADVEKVTRVSRAAPSNTGGERQQAQPVRRDTEHPRLGRCTQCGKASVKTYPTTQPSVDGGFYCMLCWDSY